MKTSLTVTVVALVLTASSACLAQADGAASGNGAPEIHSVGQMVGTLNRLGAMLDHLLHPGARKGFNPQPDPPIGSELLPAVQKMIDFCREQAGDGSVRDPRYLELLRLLEELQSLLRLGDAGGIDDELAARMAVDMFRILNLLHDIQHGGGPGIG